MKILFYDTKSYDREFFEKLLPSYPGIEIKFIEANIHEETAALAHGYDAICAFVNADLGAPVIEELHRQGVKLILMRCAGYNNVDLETAARCEIQVARVPGYSPEAVAEHAMALALTANRHTHKAYIKCRENNFALNGLMGVNFYQKTAGIIGTIQAAEAIRYLLGIPSLLTGKLLVLDGLRMQFRTVPFPHVWVPYVSPHFEQRPQPDSFRFEKSCAMLR